MQILLKANVDKVGRKGDIVAVSEGYGRNFLLKRRLGIIPTAQDIAVNKSNLAKKEALEQEKITLFQTIKKDLEDYKLTLEFKSNEDGHLFGAVKESDILEALNARFDNVLNKSMIHIASPIKAIGEYEIDINLHSNIKTKIKLYVQAKK
ncbi:MAG: hypothetical protein RLZZ223_392 [Candidatus Parcubacteria bacterium]|jgi:large subunit ribosomal protein L9